MRQHSAFSGYVKLPRAMFRQPVWRNTGASHLLVYCLMRMTVQPYGELLPGQFVASKAQMASDMGWSRTTLALHLHELETLGLLKITSTNKGTCVTVLGWEAFLQGNLPSIFCTDDTNEDTLTDMPAMSNIYSPDGIDSEQQTSSFHAEGRTDSDHDPVNFCSPACPETEQPDVQNLTPNNNSNKRKTRREYASPSDFASRPDHEDYRRIWRMYPAHRRCTEVEAYMAIDQALAKGATLPGIERALMEALRSPSWAKDNGRYVRSLVNWLATEPWQDTVPETEMGSAAWRY